MSDMLCLGFGCSVNVPFGPALIGRVAARSQRIRSHTALPVSGGSTPRYRAVGSIGREGCFGGWIGQGAAERKLARIAGSRPTRTRDCVSVSALPGLHLAVERLLVHQLSDAGYNATETAGDPRPGRTAAAGANRSE
jgi:hypothetical protein